MTAARPPRRRGRRSSMVYVGLGDTTVVAAVFAGRALGGTLVAVALLVDSTPVFLDQGLFFSWGWPGCWGDALSDVSDLPLVCRICNPDDGEGTGSLRLG